jgi:predicted ferric reductase
MKNIKIAIWAIPAILTALWVAANVPLPDTLSFIAIRNLVVQYSGVLGMGAMSVAMILATRARWLESWVNGLDKSYRLHKWLGISALVLSIAHWVASQGPKWMVGLGLIEAPNRGPRGGSGQALEGIQGFFMSQRGLAESVGEWAFYAAVLLIALALIQRFAYLALVAHSVVLLNFDDWTQPLGIAMALLMAGGVVSALLALSRQIGRGSRAAGQIKSIRTFPELNSTAVSIALNEGWAGHAAGQFAFVTFDPKEGTHPFTIASAWDPATREVLFISKALGDYTGILPRTLAVGGQATVEGPYGRFTFDDGKDRQIWIGGGVGITPFIARMKHLAKTPGTKSVDLIHSTKEVSAAALALLKADAETAGIRLHVLVDDKDGFLTGERLRKLVPDWQSASVWFCGPAGFGQVLRGDLLANGLGSDRFHQEVFNMR